MVVDARGQQCPIPVVMAKKAMKDLAVGDVLEVLVDSDICVENVTKMARNVGAEIETKQNAADDFSMKLTMTQGAVDHLSGEGETPAEEAPSAPTTGRGKIVVVNSATMGIGNDELGKVLIKGFLFAVSQLDPMPEKILFYNGGVTLTTEGSDSLEDLQKMADAGVKIYSCGTCLDYYGLKEKLAVGEVTNMYEIVESMAQAGGIIRP